MSQHTKAQADRKTLITNHVIRVASGHHCAISTCKLKDSQGLIFTVADVMTAETMHKKDQSHKQHFPSVRGLTVTYPSKTSHQIGDAFVRYLMSLQLYSVHILF